MPDQFVTVNRNLDDAAIAGLLHGEAINVSAGARLTIDSDNRWSQQAAVLGNLSIDAGTGGLILADSRNVWQVPFTASSGLVPALGVAGVQNCTGATSSATGELLGVWAAGSCEPTAAGLAMPASGYIKFRSKVGAFAAGGETVSLPGGASVTASNAGQRSWIQIVGAFQGTLSLPRLGLFEARGDWFDLGTTNGLNNQAFTLPYADICGYIWIENGTGTGVYEKWLNAGGRWVSGTATLDTDDRGKYFGQRLPDIVANTVSGSAIIATTATAGLVVGMPVNASGNFANNALFIIAINPGVSFTVSANATASASTTFVTWGTQIVLARTGTTTQGQLPPAGRRVRIPNLKLSTSRSGWQGQLSPTSNDDRYEFATNSAGSITMDTVDCGWRFNSQNAFQVSLSRVAVAININIDNPASAINLTDCGVYFDSATSSSALNLNRVSGGTVANCRFHRFNATGGGCGNITDCVDLAVTDSEFRLGGSSLTSRLRSGSDIRAMELARCQRFTIARCSFITGSLNIGSCRGITVDSMRFADLEMGTNPGATNTLFSAVNLNNASIEITFDGGFTNYAGIANIHPFEQIFFILAGCTNIDIRNIGTAASPFDCGSVNPLRRVALITASSTIAIRRVYTVNTAGDCVTITNSCRNITLDNVWADAADSLTFAASNQTNRGCRWTTSTADQFAVYGSHWEDAFTSTTAGRLIIKCNEPTAETAGQCAILAGTPRFTSTNRVAMPSVGDMVEWTLPHYLLGCTGFANTAPTINGSNTGNMALTFQWDTGAGYNGTWLALTGANLSGIGAISPTTGVRIKVRATTTVANSSNGLNFIRMDTVTNATAQQTPYPLPFSATAQISNLVPGSRIQVFNVTTGLEVANEIAPLNTWSFGYNNGTGMSAGNVIRVRIAQTSGTTAYEPFETVLIASAVGWSVLAQQVPWVVYNTWAINGALQTQFARDGINIDVDITAGGSYTKASLGAFWAWLLTTTEGIREFWGAYTFESVASIRQNVGIVNVHLQNVAVGTTVVFTDNDVRYYRSDLSIPYDTTPGFGSIFMDYAGVPLILSTGSALTPFESAHLLGLNTANLDVAVSSRHPNAPVNVGQMNGAPVIGTGAVGDAWRGVGVPP